MSEDICYAFNLFIQIGKKSTSNVFFFILLYWKDEPSQLWDKKYQIQQPLIHSHQFIFWKELHTSLGCVISVEDLIIDYVKPLHLMAFKLVQKQGNLSEERKLISTHIDLIYYQISHGKCLLYSCFLSDSRHSKLRWDNKNWEFIKRLCLAKR